MRIVECRAPCELAHLVESTALPHFNPADFESHHPDLHLSALSPSGQVQARCSLWWNHVPAHHTHCVGIVGHYAAVNDEAARDVLDSALLRLRNNGCTLAIGPMNGNTWRSYRFVTERGEHPPFFLEPANPPEWPLQFVKAGFSALASYFSAINNDLSLYDARAVVFERKLADGGVVIRAAHPDLRRELEGIYAVSQVSFRENFLYTEIPCTEFIAMYEPLLDVSRSDLVLVAECGTECVGYLFAIPDLAMKARGLDVDTFIIKTVAILPRPELRGLGTLLVSRAQRHGHELGFRKCIHALMFENNISRNISRHYASVMRKYTLYAKDLTK